MAQLSGSHDDDRARRTTLKRTLLRLGVPAAFLVAMGGATPAGAVSPACPGLATAHVAGGEDAPFETICPDVDPAVVDMFIKI